jgi:formylglycine-generating enzyme required for sulfatase activity
VDWHDARAYVTWLSVKAGKDYRLLSEAEWEYACRAGTGTPFWWCSSLSTDQANYNGNATFDGGPASEYCQRTLPVKSFQPNPWGLYQVHGNVWEWCEDWGNKSYAGAPADGSAWTTGDSFTRVMRGGALDNYPLHLRAAFRVRSIMYSRFNFNGFRLARTL